MPRELVIPPEVADHLGYYVYLYVDPRTNMPFYVGKGKGQRAVAHLSAEGETRKAATIAELRSAGMSPRLEILAHALPSEESALFIEAAVIDLLGLGSLTNLIAGQRSAQLGRTPLEELIAHYAAEPVEVADPVLLIRISKLYRFNMPGAELYDATRGVWKLSPRRVNARYALAVFEGVVREVYEIAAWHRAGSTMAGSAVHTGAIPANRWEFTGKVAEPAVRQRYLGRSVVEYLPRGLQTPVVYVNC